MSQRSNSRRSETNTLHYTLRSSSTEGDATSSSRAVPHLAVGQNDLSRALPAVTATPGPNFGNRTWIESKRLSPFTPHVILAYCTTWPAASVREFPTNCSSASRDDDVGGKPHVPGSRHLACLMSVISGAGEGSNKFHYPVTGQPLLVCNSNFTVLTQRP